MLVFALVMAATAIAGLYVTGPATLARRLHTAYSLGWAFAAIVAIGCLALPMGLEERAVLALIAGPVCGLVIHLVAQAVALRTEGAASPDAADLREERR